MKLKLAKLAALYSNYTFSALLFPFCSEKTAPFFQKSATHGAHQHSVNLHKKIDKAIV